MRRLTPRRSGIAAKRRGMRFVAVKTEDQQAMLAMQRIRQQLVRIRVMHVNQLRGLLYELGVVLPQGRRASIDGYKAALALLATSRRPCF